LTTTRKFIDLSNIDHITIIDNLIIRSPIMKKILSLVSLLQLLVLYSFSQNVGIGINNPAGKLQVNASSTAVRPLLVLSDSSAGTAHSMQLSRQGITNTWSVNAYPQNINAFSYLRFETGGNTPLTLLGDGKVGINTINPLVALEVNSTLQNVAIFNGADRMWITLSEQGTPRGYLGSYSGATEDVELGTYSNNFTGKVHLTTGNEPKLTVIPNGNVGIGTVTPVEKLQVNGSINVTQSIKANGVAGQPGQLLSVNSSGNLAWINATEFKNHISFSTLGFENWEVPPGVTRVMLEAWGGGGGGSALGGGGGGAYICIVRTVTPGDLIEWESGPGGEGGTGLAAGQEGGATQVVFPIGNNFIANGGKPAGSSTSGLIGKGGLYNGPNGGTFIGLPGQDGEPNRIIYMQSSATTFLEETMGGKGGDGGNSPHSGSLGGYRFYNLTTATQLRQAIPGIARIPGGGGAGNYNGDINSCRGGNGRVVIHY
jgi:hypothetical protein